MMVKDKKSRWGRVAGTIIFVLLLLVGAVGAGWYWGHEGFVVDDGQGESVSPSASSALSSSATASASASPSVQVKREPVFPDVKKVDRTSMEAVSRLAVTSLATWDTKADAGYGQAVQRTVPLFDESLAQQVRSVKSDAVVWDEQALAREAFSSPHVMDYDIYSDYHNDVRSVQSKSRDGQPMVSVQYAVRWDWLGRDGSSESVKDRVRVYDLWMIQDAGGDWSVASYTWRDEVETKK